MSGGGSGGSWMSGSGCGNWISDDIINELRIQSNLQSDPPTHIAKETENEPHQVCIELSSQPFVLAVLFLVILVLFLIVVGCLLALEYKKGGSTYHYDFLTDQIEEASQAASVRVNLNQ